MNKATCNNITELYDNEIFVFGSNLSGHHTGGAARLAAEKFGAEYNNGVGQMGRSYAIPTVDFNFRRTLTIQEIKPFVDAFISYTIVNAGFTFLVTEIGCGIAGHTPEDMAPLFADAIGVENIHLPERFIEILK